MLTATSYGDICASLTDYVSPKGRGQDVRLVGILFCQPHSSFMTNEIIPSLRYLNFRSGQYTNFYFAGYCEDYSADDVIPVGNKEWSFSPKIFNNMRMEFEAFTRWRYSGGSDFILANASYNSALNTALLDFSSAISVTFEKLDNDGALVNLGMFFERIFQYADTCNGIDPAWGFSDSQGKMLIGNALKSLLISVLPESLRTDAKGAFHFVSKDLNHKATSTMAMTKEEEIMAFLHERVFDPILHLAKASDHLKRCVRIAIARMNQLNAETMIQYYWSTIVGTERSAQFAQHLRDSRYINLEKVSDDFRVRFDDEWLRTPNHQ